MDMKEITYADLPLTCVEKGLADKLRAKKRIRVNVRELKSSSGIIFSPDFSRCQGICFFAADFQIGALAHNYSAHDPYNFLSGRWQNLDTEEKVEDLRKIFEDTSRVVPVHVYHRGNHEWPEIWVDSALRKIGIRPAFHIPINSKEFGKWYLRDIFMDVEKGLVYVFPTDHDYGICLDVRRVGIT